MFSIDFTDEPPFPWDEDGPLHRYGLTVLNNFSERFAAPLDYWAEDDYQRQWREGIERLVGGAATSCLVTRMEDPAAHQILQFWELFRLEDIVAVHERLWVPDFGRLDPEAVYEAVKPYERVDGDGATLSEWRLPISDFANYLAG